MIPCFHYSSAMHNAGRHQGVCKGTSLSPGHTGGTPSTGSLNILYMSMIRTRVNALELQMYVPCNTCLISVETNMSQEAYLIICMDKSISKYTSWRLSLGAVFQIQLVFFLTLMAVKDTCLHCSRSTICFLFNIVVLLKQM